MASRISTAPTAPIRPSRLQTAAGWFTTPYDVLAGVRESRTRRGTIRRTARLTRQNVRIEEWPRLRRWIEEELIERRVLAEALQHMRCIEAFMAAARHPSIPRILRTAGGTVAGAIAGGSSPLLMPLTAFLPSFAAHLVSTDPESHNYVLCRRGRDDRFGERQRRGRRSRADRSRGVHPRPGRGGSPASQDGSCRGRASGGAGCWWS